MANTFIVQIKDDIQRRIVIDKDVWRGANLKKGDYIEVTIRRVELGGRD